MLDGTGDISDSIGQQQPTLLSLVHLLYAITVALERTGEEKFLLLNKVLSVVYVVAPIWSLFDELL